jgi:flagellar hook assembly protein FlgD
VFDISGRRVRTLADDALDAGVHAFAWDGRTAGGDAVAAGVYFAKLHAMGQERTVKLIRRR